MVSLHLTTMIAQNYGDKVVFYRLQCCIIVFLGIQYLREYLHLPQEIVPATLKRPVRTEGARPRPKGVCVCVCAEFHNIMFCLGGGGRNTIMLQYFECVLLCELCDRFQTCKHKIATIYRAIIVGVVSITSSKHSDRARPKHGLGREAAS